MSEQRRRGPMGGPRRGMMPGEKAKDFKGSMAKLFRYMDRLWKDRDDPVMDTWIICVKCMLFLCTGICNVRNLQ